MGTEQVKLGEESVKPVAVSTEVSALVDNQAGEIRTSVGAKVDDSIATKEIINLGIDWDSLDKESLFTSMQTFDDAENLHPKVPGNRHDTYVIHTCELTTISGEKLLLEVSKVISPNFHELQIGIIRPNIEETKPEYRYVAGFDFLQLKEGESEEWDMKHRQTSEPYKNQGIAGKIIGLTEEILKNRSSENNLAQAISAKSGQRDLTAWLEKRNFKAATPQDVEMLKRLKDMDSDLQEVIMYGETYTFDAIEFKRKFPELSGPDDPAVWDYDNYEKPFFYMKSCFKIKLKKNIN